jgi:transposase
VKVFFFEREMGGRRYRVAAQSVWDAKRGRPVSRQTTLGPADDSARVDLGALRTVGTCHVGDVGALAWVAEQLDVIGIIDRACGFSADPKAPTLGEMVLAVATQRACAPSAKRDLGEFLDNSLARVSCLSGRAFTGQLFHRMGTRVTDEQLEQVQIELARAAVAKFDLTTDVLAFDTTNFDTHIATTTPGELARRGHAKSKRSDLRVVGLALLASETGHVPLLYRTYPGNGSDQGVLEACLDGLGRLHDALDQGEKRVRPAQRTLVRDGGSWSEQLELDLDMTGYFTLISLPLGHRAAEEALQAAAAPRAMKSLKGDLKDVRACRIRTKVGKLDRTLVVVESRELLEGQKRGIAAALRKARTSLATLARQVEAGRIRRSVLEQRAKKAVAREHLSDFVLFEFGGTEERPTFRPWVDDERRSELERTRLGKRVLCTDRHSWSDERVVRAFRGQWHVEELFRRSKKGGVVPWGPSFQWADGSLRLHTFATVLGLMLVSLAKLALKTTLSAKAMMTALAAIDATLVRPESKTKGRAPTYYLAPSLSVFQARAVRTFQLDRWLPSLLSIRPSRRSGPAKEAAA